MAGMAVYDTIKQIRADICTVCVGTAASMGAFLLSSGAKGKRFALPNARIMIRQPSGGAQGPASLPEKPFDRSDDYEKILVEQVVMADPDLPGTILRLPMVYGPRDFRHRLFPYLQRIDDNRPAIVLAESIAQWRGPYGYVENVAEAIALAVTDERAANRIYNIAEHSTGSH